MLASQDVNPEISVNPAADEVMPAAAGGSGIGISLPRTILPDAIISKRLHGKTAFVIPALSVTLHTVHLPVRGQAQKLAALPYALEEDIGRPEAEIHHALCGASADGAMLAAAVSREAMTLAVDAADGALVTPEHFLLPVPAPADGPGMVMSILSSNRRSGVWSVPRRMNVLAVMGSLELDLRDARFEPGVTRIDVLNVMGSVEIMAPEGVVVESDGIGVLGNFEGTTRGAENPDANAPVLRIRGVAVMGHTATN